MLKIVHIAKDTGMTLVFVEVGQDVHFVGGDLKEAINEGVAQGYVEGYLRKSVVAEPLFNRKNTQNNTCNHLHRYRSWR
ncbi:MAG: fumarate hydratase [Veillonella sp.]